MPPEDPTTTLPVGPTKTTIRPLQTIITINYTTIIVISAVLQATTGPILLLRPAPILLAPPTKEETLIRTLHHLLPIC